MPERYPPEAFTENGVLWWEAEIGAERKIAAWLFFNRKEGETFTMPDLRAALGDGVVPNAAEHLNRRLRSLRPDGWVIPSNKDDRTLPVGTYRVERKGWHPGQGQRPAKGGVSDAIRRKVFDRDGRRCVVCGVGSREPYPDLPNKLAVLTIGHRIPQAMGGSSRDPDNLQVECKRCNEPVRGDLGRPETSEQLLLEVRNLKTAEIQTLLLWLRQGYRGRNKVDVLFDRARMLSAGERASLTDQLAAHLGER